MWLALPRTSQPPAGTPLDPTHPSAGGLRALMLADGAGALNAASQQFRPGGGNYVPVATPYGRAIGAREVARAPVVTTGAPVVASASNRAISLLFLVRLNDFNGTIFSSAATDRGATLYTQRDVGPAVSPTLCVSTTDFVTGGLPRFWFGADVDFTANGVNSTTTVATNQWYWVAATYPASETVFSAARIYVGTPNSAMADVTDGSNPRAGTFNSLWSGSVGAIGYHPLWPDAGGPDTASMDIAFAAVWDRELLLHELRALSANPWQLFEPDRVWIGAATPGGTTLSVARATALATGRLVEVLRARVVDVPRGTVLATGRLVDVVRARVLDVARATLTASGRAVDVVRARVLDVARATVTATGRAIDLGVGAVVAVSLATVLATGRLVDVVRARVVDVARATLTASGRAVDVMRARVLDVARATVTATGRAIDLGVGAVVAVSLATVLATGRLVSVVRSTVLAVVRATATAGGRAVQVFTVLAGGARRLATLLIANLGRLMGR